MNVRNTEEKLEEVFENEPAECGKGRRLVLRRRINPLFTHYRIRDNPG
jgi:hypothetical protein